MKMEFVMLRHPRRRDVKKSERGNKMKLNYVILSALSCLLIGADFASAKVDDKYAKAWGLDGNPEMTTAVGDFIIDGALKMGGSSGTYGDEWGVVALVAEQAVEHGGYFCPYQLQCANKHCKGSSWLRVFEPTGYEKSKCAWFCEKGYTGTNCGKQKVATTGMNTPTTTSDGGLFSGVTMKQSGKDKNDKYSSVLIFGTSVDSKSNASFWQKMVNWNVHKKYNRQGYFLLGAIEFKEHGIVAAPVYLACYAEHRHKNKSWVEGLETLVNGGKLLCAEGYTPNSSDTDCILATDEMLAVSTAVDEAGKEFCTGWDETAFDSKIHMLDTSSDDCIRFWCRESGKAFAGPGDKQCVDCATGIKGGQSKLDGTCVKCQSGEYFNQSEGKCLSAAAYSKTDLQYGKDKTKNSGADLEDQCWTILTPDEYRECVENGGPVENNE